MCCLKGIKTLGYFYDLIHPSPSIVTLYLTCIFSSTNKKKTICDLLQALKTMKIKMHWNVKHLCQPNMVSISFRFVIPYHIHNGYAEAVFHVIKGVSNCRFAINFNPTQNISFLSTEFRKLLENLSFSMKTFSLLCRITFTRLHTWNIWSAFFFSFYLCCLKWHKSDCEWRHFFFCRYFTPIIQTYICRWTISFFFCCVWTIIWINVLE